MIIPNSEINFQDDNWPTVMIGGPVHNKHWVVDAYIDSLISLDYPKDKVSLVFYINDSTDGTKEKFIKRLQAIKKERNYRRILVVEQNYGYMDFQRAARPRMELFAPRYTAPPRSPLCVVPSTSPSRCPAPAC